jgi:hypothetical protein
LKLDNKKNAQQANITSHSCHPRHLFYFKRARRSSLPTSLRLLTFEIRFIIFYKTEFQLISNRLFV